MSKISAIHHAGIRVSDLERSIGFYEEVFAARPITNVRELEGKELAALMDGPDDVSCRVVYLRIGDGIVELFEFVRPAVPASAPHQSEAAIMHVGIQVEDVDAALERLDRAGGHRVSHMVRDLGGARVTYAADPDGNVIELADRTMLEIAELVSPPEQRPGWLAEHD